MSDSAIHAHREGVVLTVRVQPRAARSEIVDVRDGLIRIRLAAAPVDGAANAALLELLAEALSVRKRDVTLISGDTSRSKRVLVKSLRVEEAEERLSGAIH
jgi:uncharacterized protein (TIGR00251 family)